MSGSVISAPSERPASGLEVKDCGMDASFCVAAGCLRDERAGGASGCTAGDAFGAATAGGRTGRGAGCLRDDCAGGLGTVVLIMTGESMGTSGAGDSKVGGGISGVQVDHEGRLHLGKGH